MTATYGPLLAPLMDCDVGKPCLVLDLGGGTRHGLVDIADVLRDRPRIERCPVELGRGVTGEVHHVDAGYHVQGMKNEDAPDISVMKAEDGA